MTDTPTNLLHSVRLDIPVATAVQGLRSARNRVELDWRAR
ncbi:hypothetical protein ACWT_5769 [Actinoplanes sp. SE50]|nr:hypothetical protein ACPL_5900 [Actinoplanes sp. SE50/110]ATO85184.1 hypothetical protein ACWT_5769 [Actinoplanes sp. SE50]SLM02594.1 hypothetical protein ACSP50_5876 [Actinoplanes sp. SE50/110]